MITKSCRALLALLLGFLLLAGADEAFATTMSDADFTCGFCGKTFKDKMIWSTNVMDRDAEFRPYAMGIDPLPYYVHVCPHCGYTDGGERSPLSEKEKVEVGKYLTAYRASHAGPLRPADKYEVLANLCIIRKFSPDKIASAYQQAAWMADDAHDATAARKFRAATLEYLTKALKDPKVDPKTAPVLTYLAGELNRRLGRFDEALQWFARVKPTGPDLDSFVKQQTELARKKDARPDRLSPLR